MKPRKLNPKIIRVYDTVKIVNPVFVIRCGYPLGAEDMRQEIREHYGRAIQDLMDSVRNGNKLVSSDPNFSLSSCSSEERSHSKIIDALAYIRLRAKDFGGDKRTLHTKVIEELRGKETTVQEIKIVKTGTYVSGNELPQPKG